MSQVRMIGKISVSRETMEGAGVRLHRGFGYHEIPDFDPFLMFDDFRADNPSDYLAGFPWHPHRGIETVTYMLEGTVEHRDSMGHSGTVHAGGVQWMTAGSGIIHQEMPKPIDGRMGGFQLWINLPKSHKMMDPRYQEMNAEQIPHITLMDGITARVICGTVNGVSGPVHDIVADPEYVDISMEPGTRLHYPVTSSHTVAVYVIDGSGTFDPNQKEELENRAMIVYGVEGNRVEVQAGTNGVRFLLFSGRPIKEPIAWGGPIVMNTEEELRQAFFEYENNTFIRKR